MNLFQVLVPNLFKNRNSILSLSILLLFVYSCEEIKSESEAEVDYNAEGYFEGEISLRESGGVAGALIKKFTTYIISENKLKREQRLDFGESRAGIIIDLVKDSVVLYYIDGPTGTKNKHTLSTAEYLSKLKTESIPRYTPSMVDRTFRLLDEYQLIKLVEDSVKIKGFDSDYSLFYDKDAFFKQEVFDTKDIKVKRNMLEMAFPNMPTEINFPLTLDSKTILTEISNDSIISGRRSKALDQFLRNAFGSTESGTQKKTDLDKLAKNKWLQKGLNIFKKGVDFQVQFKTEIIKFTSRTVTNLEFSFEGEGFTEIANFQAFLDARPKREDDDDDDDDHGHHFDFDDLDFDD